MMTTSRSRSAPWKCFCARFLQVLLAFSVVIGEFAQAAGANSDTTSRDAPKESNGKNAQADLILMDGSDYISRLGEGEEHTKGLTWMQAQQVRPISDHQP